MEFRVQVGDFERNVLQPGGMEVEHENSMVVGGPGSLIETDETADIDVLVGPARMLSETIMPSWSTNQFTASFTRGEPETTWARCLTGVGLPLCRR